jgi:hypothetical protein
VLKKASRSVFFSVPDGAYTFIIRVPLKSTAIPRPEGRRVMLRTVRPSFVRMAIPLPSVPRLMCAVY